MPSAAGKRVGRVLAGRSKPEARDKPGRTTWQVILGTRSLHRSPDDGIGVPLTFMNLAVSGMDRIHVNDRFLSVSEPF